MGQNPATKSARELQQNIEKTDGGTSKHIMYAGQCRSFGSFWHPFSFSAFAQINFKSFGHDLLWGPSWSPKNILYRIPKPPLLHQLAGCLTNLHGGTVVITYELVIMQNTIWLTNKRHMLTRTLLPKYMHILCIIYYHYVLYERTRVYGTPNNFLNMEF